jgi:DNA (cytosine-5)-methyltransferase 1
MKPRILDLFCGAGGAAMGYSRAGFEVVGVDIKPQPRYPFEFHQGDALDVLESIRDGGHWFYEIGEPAAIHASPPCQAYSNITSMGGDRSRHARLIDSTRHGIHCLGGTPYVIENVTGARRELLNPVRLCGSMFDLGAVCDDGQTRYLERHRYFECDGFWMLVPSCQHVGEAIGVYGVGGRNHNSTTRKHKSHGYIGDFRERAEAMQIDWMNKAELSEAIPPAYTEHLGTHLLTHIEAGSRSVKSLSGVRE